MGPRAKRISVRFSPPLSAADRQTAMAPPSEAHQLAIVANRDRWEFAVELATLLAAGASVAALRFLVHDGYLDHAQEVTRNGDALRRFRPVANLSFPPGTCFVLTDKGVRYGLEYGEGVLAQPWLDSRSSTAIGSPHCRPVWSTRERTLVLGGRVVLRYLYRSPNQELVLTVFQEEGWPSRIDDPLPFVAGLDAKQRIRDTVRALNAKQAEHLIGFRSDGSGQCVVWQLISAAAAGPVLAVLPRRRAA
jgi:hypothetical protein